MPGVESERPWCEEGLTTFPHKNEAENPEPQLERKRGDYFRIRSLER